MNKRKLLLLVTLALVLLLGVLVVEGAGQSDGDKPAPLPVTFSYKWARTIEPGKYWVDEKGAHIRSRADQGKIDGGIEGSAVVYYNADLSNYSFDPAGKVLPGNGNAWGTMRLFGNLSQSSSPRPSWTGNFSHSISNGLVVGGSMTAYSPDGNWVMRITSIEEAEDGYLVYTGTISYECVARICD